MIKCNRTTSITLRNLTISTTNCWGKLHHLYLVTPPSHGEKEQKKYALSYFALGLTIFGTTHEHDTNTTQNNRVRAVHNRVWANPSQPKYDTALIGLDPG